MAKKKPLHIDHEGREVVPVGERETVEGTTVPEYIHYDHEDYKNIEFPYLTGIEAATLILGGVEIKRCYIAELNVQHFIRAKQLLINKQTHQKVLARFQESRFKNSSKINDLSSRVDQVDSVFTHPAVNPNSKHPDILRIMQHIDGQFTQLNVSIKFLECILAEVEIAFIKVEGFVSLNKRIKITGTRRIVGLSSNPIVESLPTDKPFLATVIFGIEIKAIETKNNLDVKNCIIYRGKSTNQYGCLLHGTIGESLSLEHSKFHAPVGFATLKATTVKGRLWAQDAEFYDVANFNGLSVGNLTDFHNVKFHADVSFLEAKFLGNANFPFSQFKGEAKFDKAEFHHDAVFNGSKFNNKASFVRTEFKDTAVFRFTVFERALFNNACFHGDADFSLGDDQNRTDNTRFADVRFHRTRFRMSSDFRDVQFSKTDFTKATFAEPLQLQGSTFEELDFMGVTVPEIRMQFKDVDPEFRKKRILRPHRITESDCEPPPYPYKEWSDKKRWEEAQRQYSMLKENFRKLGQYKDEDNAHRWASECARLALSKLNPWRYIKWFIMKKILGYGVKPQNVLLTILVVILIAWAFFSAGYNDLSFDDGAPPTGFWWLNTLYFSFITYATVGFGDVSPTGWLVIVAMVEGILGVMLNAAFIVVIFRKLIR